MTCLKRGAVVSRSLQVVILLVSLALYPCVGHTAPGDLDKDFGDEGTVTTSIGSSEAHAIAVQPDGKIVVVGPTLNTKTNKINSFVARYDTKGILDTITFGKGRGWVITDLTKVFSSADFRADAVAIQPDDGKIVVAGTAVSPPYYYISVARYQSDGDLDPSFGSLKKGVEITLFMGPQKQEEAFGIAVQPNDEKILVAGTSYNGTDKDIVLVKYTKKGELDKKFGGGKGWVTTDFKKANDTAHAVVIQSNEKIVVVGTSEYNSGSDFVLAQYDNNGKLDSSFGTNGKVTTNFNDNAATNNTFDEASAVAIQPDRKIVVAGTSNRGKIYDFALARYDRDGKPDSSFGISGKVTTDFNNNSVDRASAVAIQPDGKIVVAGTSNQDVALARYNSNGELDLTFGSSGKVTLISSGSYDTIYAAALQPDGKIVVAGSTSNKSTSKIGLARYMGGTVPAPAAAPTPVTGAVTVEEPEATPAGEAEVVGGVGVTAGESEAATGGEAGTIAGEASPSALEGGGGCSLLPSLR